MENCVMTNEELVELIDELRALPKETEWIEFKSNTATTNQRLGRYISGISNAACINHKPFGYLIFGIDDTTHRIVGTTFNFKNRKEGNEELEFWLRRLLKPSVKFQHFVCQYNHLYVEIFKIPAAHSEPVNFERNPYIRIGTNLTDLRNYPDYMRDIYNAQEDWSAKVVERATIDVIDPSAIAKAREKFKEAKENTKFVEEVDSWSDATFLDKIKVTIGGKITNTAIILLGKPEASHYILPAVAQITWKLDTEEKAYEHFETPFFLTINDILKRIRNVKYKFFPENQLISVEVNKYNTEVILEALNNCIAHQDYSRNARILLTEQTKKLIFENEGGFIDGNPDDYALGTKTPKLYRNKWLINAMVKLGMIDSMGYGINKMYRKQMERYFPLPDYRQSTREKVHLEIYGHTIDENYSKLLIEKKDLPLTEVLLLDKIQKGENITEEGAKLLKKQDLIEGRKGRYYISAEIAEISNQKTDYTRNKGLQKKFYKELILQHIQNYKSATREEIDKLLWDKLPDSMNEKQKRIHINNLLGKMSGIHIQNSGSRAKPKWTLLNKNL
jgi:ATP-dependent DNA helicase RecG